MFVTVTSACFQMILVFGVCLILTDHFFARGLGKLPHGINKFSATKISSGNASAGAEILKSRSGTHNIILSRNKKGVLPLARWL